MRLTLNTFLTLDGVMQAPGAPEEDRRGEFEHGGWQFPYADDEDFALIAEWLTRADAFPLGRITYEIFANYWPTVTDENDPIASRLNAHDLIDEYRLLTYPVVLGGGQRLFGDANAAALRLVDVKHHNGSDAIIAIYEPSGKPRYGSFADT